MDPHEPFLKAILASRHDDLPRLVYADWLEESGDPANLARAHFIRTQVHLEQAEPKSKLFKELKALEARILDTYLDEWRWVDLPEFVRYGSELDQVKWRRGFPDDLGPMRFRVFTAFGAEALDKIPLTSLHLSDRSSEIQFHLYPALRHLSRLSIGPSSYILASTPLDDTYPTPTFDSLMTAPVFTGLTHLDLSENDLTDAWLVRFASTYSNASFAPTLRTLNLSANFQITDAGANVLATSAAFDQLTSLCIRDTAISAAGRAMLKKRFDVRLI